MSDFHREAEMLALKIGGRCMLDDGWFDTSRAAACIEPVLRQMAGSRVLVPSVPQPTPLGGDYRPHYNKRDADRYIGSLESLVRDLAQEIGEIRGMSAGNSVAVRRFDYITKACDAALSKIPKEMLP